MIEYFSNFKWKKFLYKLLIEENKRMYIVNSKFKFNNFSFFINEEKFYEKNIRIKIDN